MDPRGRIALGGSDGVVLNLEFTQELIAPPAWLEQWIYSPPVTLRRLIGAVTNDEVAHTEATVAKAIEQANVVKFGGRSAGRELHSLAIVTVGLYVAFRTRQMLAGV